MTHKGEIEIDRDYNEPLDKTNDFDTTADKINKSVNNSPKKSNIKILNIKHYPVFYDLWSRTE